jgi:hypothetical protein
VKLKISAKSRVMVEPEGCMEAAATRVAWVPNFSGILGAMPFGGNLGPFRWDGVPRPRPFPVQKPRAQGYGPGNPVRKVLPFKRALVPRAVVYPRRRAWITTGA